MSSDQADLDPVPAEPANDRGTDGRSTPDQDGTAGELSAEEPRVLACLIEKANTTPDQYPLSSNALTAACNQKSSREPVVHYSQAEVDRVMQLLRDGGWARSIRGTGNRTFKHKHVIEERLGLDQADQALIAVLALRGPQSPGELKTRTDRYHPFADLADVERVLARLADRRPALVRDVGRGSGQSQNRWIQLLGPTPGAQAPAAADGPDTGPSADRPPPMASASVPASMDPAPVERPSDDAAVAELRDRVGALERRLADLERELGLRP